jgi:hypothetical protein
MRPTTAVITEAGPVPFIGTRSGRDPSLPDRSSPVFPPRRDHTMKILSPVRARRCFTQRLRGSAADVFPLLCPVREAEWIDGWEPEVVYSASGRAEEGCVFVTRDGGDEAIWVIDVHDPEAGILEMVKSTPGCLVTRIRIEVADDGPGRSRARVAYEHTSLSPRGDGLVAAFTEDRYRALMERWEARLNHFLTTGRMLRDLEDGP